MNSVSRSGRRALVATAGITAAALALAACGGGSSSSQSSSGSSGGGSLTIGTSDKITTLDPAGAYDNGSFTLMEQGYPVLMKTTPGHPHVEPGLAQAPGFPSP